MDILTQAQTMTETIAKFIAYFGKVLPDDVCEKLSDMAVAETDPMATLVYDTMFRNQELAQKLNRPCCQDTGVIQFFPRVGAHFPLIDELENIFTNAVLDATKRAPLRHNAVETFDEKNTGCNVGYRVPCIDWQIVPNSDELDLNIYMAGGGCTLPGKAMVLMPGAGYEGVTQFVLDQMTSYGLNACPPLLVGVGVATSVEQAAILSKRALMRPLGTHNPNPRAAMMEEELERGINAIGLGPQGLSGSASVLGVHIENAARHPSTIGVAVNTGCWSHRRGHIIFKSDLSYEIISHKEAVL
ncbi:MAG: L(+)-tartrate dehydratase subunit alpha [Clostridia bacterium]|nr:L(+)-tartrate dehydratase subunit alpha [Clostridia bacterium]